MFGVQVVWLPWILASLMAFSAPKKNTAGYQYIEAIKAFNGSRWSKAEEHFQRALRLLSEKKAKSKKAKGFLMLGQCDILYHLSLTAKKQKRTTDHCLFLERFDSIRNKLPKNWRRWKVNPGLARRFRKASKLYTVCENTPSTLSFRGLPAGATVEQESLDEKGLVIGWKKVKLPLKTTEKRLRLRISAPGYHTSIQWFTLAKWRININRISLLAKANQNRTEVPPPPKKRKKAISVWVWVGVAVLVVGAATVVTVLAVRSSGSEEALPKDKTQEMIIVP